METKANVKTPKKTTLLTKFLALPESTVTITLLVLVAVTGIFSKSFFSEANLLSVLRNLAFFAIVSVGMGACLLVGKIDLSMGHLAGLGAMVCTWCITAGGMPPLVAILVAQLMACVFGLINGFLVAYVGLVPFIVTIGTQYLARGLKYMVSNGYPIYPLPDGVNQFGLATPLGISWAFFIALLLLLAFDVVLKRTTFGRNLYAVGDNPEVAKMSGIDDRKMVLGAYVLSGNMAVMAGWLLAFQLNSGMPTMGEGWEFQAVTAIAVGGVSLSGGKGTMLGTLLGVIFIAVLNNSLVLFKINNNIVTILTGVVMVAAVTVDVLNGRAKVKG